MTESKKKIFSDVCEIAFDRFVDHRGGFARKYCLSRLNELGIHFDPKQFSVSYNPKKGTLRGLHFQTPPFEEAKIVGCVQGAIFDVVVDIRHESKTFGSWEAFTLTSELNNALYIPKGFAHGFQTLTNDTIVSYVIDADYHKSNASGIYWADKDLKVPWPETEFRTVSQKDGCLPTFKEFNYKTTPTDWGL